MKTVEQAIKASRIKQISAYLSIAGLRHNKADVFRALCFDVKNFDDLNEEQLEQLHNWSYRAYTAKTTEPDSQVRHHRSILLTLINKLGYYITENDWTNVNRFLLSPKIARSPLYMLDVDELMGLERKLRAMLRKTEEGGDKMTLARQDAAASGYKPAELVDLADDEPLADQPPKSGYIPSINISLAPPKGQLLS